MVSLRLAIDEICVQYKKTVISVLLIFIGSLLAVFAVISYSGVNYAYDSCDRLLVRGIKGTAFVELYDSGYEDIYMFFNDDTKGFIGEVCSLPEVSAFGDCFEFDYDIDAAPELYEIQKHDPDFTDDGYWKVSTMNKNLPAAFKLDIAEGKRPEELDFAKEKQEKEIVYLYLGNAYKDIPIGTEFQDKYSRFIVAGILDGKQEMLDYNLVNGFYEAVSYAKNFDYGIIGITDEPPNTSRLWLSAAEGFSIEQALSAAEKVAEKYGIGLKYTTLQDSYELNMSDSMLLGKYLLRLAWILIPSIALMLICVQATSVLGGLRQYGVLYSLGFSKKNIVMSIVIKNVILCILSLALVLPSALVVGSLYFDDSIKMVFETVMVRNAVPVALFMNILIVCMISAVSLGVLSRYSITELISGGKND